MQEGRKELGDRVAYALSIVGITEDRVTRWIGAPCGCARRREKLNQIDRWARRILRGHVEKAEQYLEEITSEED